MNRPEIVSRAEWLAARKALLAKGKEFTRHRDALNASRLRSDTVNVTGLSFARSSTRRDMVHVFLATQVASVKRRPQRCGAGTTILLVEQNVRMGLRVVHRGWAHRAARCRRGAAPLRPRAQDAPRQEDQVT